VYEERWLGGHSEAGAARGLLDKLRIVGVALAKRLSADNKNMDGQMMRKSWRGYRRWLLAAVVVLWAGGPAWAESEIDGAWTGEYICQQGRTALDLQISGADTRNLSAMFYFHAASDGLLARMLVPNGCFLMRGLYNPAISTLTLVPGKWMQKPFGYVSVGLQGRMKGDTISGQIFGPGCATFLLKRGDDGAERPEPCGV
jgi:hypothetical protein